MQTEPWDERYQDGSTPWDLGTPSALVLRLIDEELVPPARVLVVGCGRGWEVEALADRGFETTGLDIAPTALRFAADRIGRRASVTLREGDVLDLPPEFRNHFDVVVEHTCLCALDPALWSQYVDAVAGALREGGRMLGAFLRVANAPPEPPPYGIDVETVHALFESRFAIRKLSEAPEVFPPLVTPDAPDPSRAAQFEFVLDLR